MRAAAKNCRVRRPTLQSCMVNETTSYYCVGGGAANAHHGRCYSSYVLPPVVLERAYTVRLFSKFSTDEVIRGSPSNTAAPNTNLSSELQQLQSTVNPNPHPLLINNDADDINSVEKKSRRSTTNTNKKLLIDLQDSHELFYSIAQESQTLLKKNNANATNNGDEIVAMADYFLILVNSLDLEKHLDLVQSLQDTLLDNDEKKDEKDKDERAIEDKLHQASKSMSQLHHVFLKMVESCLPPHEMNEVSETGDSSTNLYSAKTVGRGLQLTRRAEELGMPMHRPMYQRLVLGSVITSSNVLSANNAASPATSYYDQAEDINESNDTSADDPATTLIMPGQFQQSKEGTVKSPLVLEMLDILQCARISLKCISGEQLHQLAEDLLAKPFLILLKSKQFEDAMCLLRGWQALFDYGTRQHIELLTLLGEDNIIDALEIAKGWLDGSDLFTEDVLMNPRAMELTVLLELALAEIIQARKRRMEKISDLVWELSMQNEEDVDNFDEHESTDDDGGDIDIEFDDYDSDSDSDEEEDVTRPSLIDELYTKDDGTMTTAYRAADNSTTESSHQENDDTDTFTIMRGLSNEEARQSIYLRNGTDWILPDCVSQIEDYNACKGKTISFTPMFEQYIGFQITKEDEEEC